MDQNATLPCPSSGAGSTFLVMKSNSSSKCSETQPPFAEISCFRYPIIHCAAVNCLHAVNHSMLQENESYMNIFALYIE